MQSDRPHSFVQTIAAFEENAIYYAERYGDVENTDPGALPRAGTATYNGEMVFSTSTDIAPETLLIVGQLRMTADFGAASNAIGGSVSNLFDAGENRYVGTLDIVDGNLSRGEVIGLDTITADLRGTLTRDAEALSVEAGLTGGFGGPNVEVALGSVRGIIESSDEARNILGVFVGER